MTAEQLFEGFDPDGQARYEAELIDRYGADARTNIAESKRRTAGTRQADAERIQREWQEILARASGPLPGVCRRAVGAIDEVSLCQLPGGPR